MPAASLPPLIAALVANLAALPGVSAVVLGGSQATGEAGPTSDWDIGLYYRTGAFDPAAVAALGHPGYVSGLGEWGPIVDGGAWLMVDGLPVDVLFRDRALVERRVGEAERGAFEVVAQTGCVAGAPTYVHAGELALCIPLMGEELPRPAFPAALAAAAPPRWEGRAAVALLFAGIHARGGDPVACSGQLAVAVLCAAHARLAARGEWALNEKRLVDRAGLADAGRVLAAPGASSIALADAVDEVSARIRIAPLQAR